MCDIDRREVQRLLEREGVRLVMALPPIRHRDVHIPGSEAFGDIEQALRSLDRDDVIVVYCSHPESPASRWAAHLLTGRGYRNVRRYAGGIADWSAAGLPLAGRTVTTEVAA